MTAFHNKSVLVLGGSRGIGAAIVRRFVADGASVVFSIPVRRKRPSGWRQRPAARRCRRTAPIAMR